MLEEITNTEDYLYTNDKEEVIILTREDMENLYHELREVLLYS